MPNGAEAILENLKKLQRIPPGTPKFLETQKEIMKLVKKLSSKERKGLRDKVERMRSDIRIYRPSYYTPDYFRILTVLSQRLTERDYETIKKEIEENFEEIEKSFESGHFPRYPSSYIKKLRALVMEAIREEDIEEKEVKKLRKAVEKMVERIKKYEYKNITIEVSASRIRVNSLFTVGANRSEWSIELISPKLEYGGRSFLKRRVLAYITKEQRPLSRPEIEEGVGKKIRYFGHIVQSLVRKYLILPIPGENKYELTGTGERVGEVYIELIDEGDEED
jgi:hypothetical protein